MALDKILYLDLETTDKDIFKAEIITGYFLDNNGNEYDFRSQTDCWSEEAEGIHKISYGRMKTFPKKNKAHIDLFNWLKKYEDYTWICYANPNTIYGYIHFDRGVLINSFLELGLDLKIDNLISVYNMAKEAYKKKLFVPAKGNKGRISFSQENVYKALFNKKYNAHNAKEDVMSMIYIYKKLDAALKSNLSANNNQSLLI